MSRDQDWPMARLSPIARLRTLAAGLPSSALEERLLPHDVNSVWTYFADMERSLPTFDTAVGRLTVVQRTGTRLVARVRSPRLRVPVTFDIDLEPGWCWMTARNRLYAVGFAAEPAGDQTRFAHLEAFTPAGPAWLRAAAERALRNRRDALRRHVLADIKGLELALEACARSGSPGDLDASP